MTLRQKQPIMPGMLHQPGRILQEKRLRSTVQLQRTANSVLTVCHTPGDNPTEYRITALSVTLDIPDDLAAFTFGLLCRLCFRFNVHSPVRSKPVFTVNFFH